MSYARKGKNCYYGYASVKDKNGHWTQESAGCYKLRRQALAAADKLEQEYKKLNVNLKDISLYDYFIHWFKTYKEKRLSDVSNTRYRLHAKRIKQYFGDTRLRDIKRSEYQAFINRYGADHAYKSVSKLNGAIRACVSFAIDDDIITKDFTHNVQVIYNPDKAYKVKYLSSDELVVLRKAVVKGLAPYNTSRYMILTAIYTGMRKSEIQALTWNDINFLNHTITVNKSWDEHKKAFKSTKTTSSNRVIKVNPILLKYLADLKANKSVMVFRNSFNTIPTSNALNKCLRSIMKAAGIEKQGFHFHSLRHVHVAYLLGQGVDIYAISKRLGHSKVTTTLNTYSYLIDEYRAKNDNLIVDKLAHL